LLYFLRVCMSSLTLDITEEFLEIWHRRQLVLIVPNPSILSLYSNCFVNRNGGLSNPLRVLMDAASSSDHAALADGKISECRVGQSEQ
jgi:hypothetical protein